MTGHAGKDEGSPSQSPVGRARGVLVTEGTALSIHGLRIGLGPEGVSVTHTGTSLRLDVCRHWLRIAVDHVGDAAAAKRELLAAQSTGREADLACIIEREFKASMQAIVSSAIALDSFYTSVKKNVPIPQAQATAWRKKRTARWKQMAEVFRRAFGLSPRGLVNVRHHLKEAFRYRGWVVHPPDTQESPVLRDDIMVGVEWRLVAFSSGNAAAIVQMSLALISQLLKRSPLEPEGLAKYCEGLRPAVEALVSSWEQEYPSYPVAYSRPGVATSATESLPSQGSPPDR